MKQLTNKVKNKLNNFFNNFFNNGDVSETEMLNFLENYKDYIFLLNGYNPKNFNVSFHLAGESKEDRAFMDIIKPFYYDIYFHLNSFSISKDKEINKIICKFKHLDDVEDYDKLINELRDLSFNKQFVKLLSIIEDAGHEMQHVIQTLDKYKSFQDYNEYLNNLRDTQELLKLYPNCKDKKRDQKFVKRLIDITSFSCKLEKDADKMCYEYAIKLLTELSETCEDKNFEMFLHAVLIDHIEASKNKRKFDHRIYKQIHQKMKKRYNSSIISDKKIFD